MALANAFAMTSTVTSTDLLSLARIVWIPAGATAYASPRWRSALPTCFPSFDSRPASRRNDLTVVSPTETDISYPGISSANSRTPRMILRISITIGLTVFLIAHSSVLIAACIFITALTIIYVSRPAPTITHSGVGPSTGVRIATYTSTTPLR